MASAEDYFSRESLEYRLLERGIALHHGKMPGLLARRLKRLIDAGLVRVVIATSTLSEGVNIPVNYLLVPSVHRGTSRFSVQEFTNLIGERVDLVLPQRDMLLSCCKNANQGGDGRDLPRRTGNDRATRN